MKLISDLETKNNIDIDLYNSKNFNSYENYKKLYGIYYQGLCKYLDSIYDTNIIDKKIEKSNLYFGKVLDENKNIYFKMNLLNSNYIFIRNYLNIERLDQKDIDILYNKTSVDDEVLDIVKRTYKDIIISNNSKYVFYGPSSLDFRFNNNSLVFMINYWKNTKDFSGEEFINISKMQILFLDYLCNEIKNIYTDKLGIPVEVKYYKGAISIR